MSGQAVGDFTFMKALTDSWVRQYGSIEAAEKAWAEAAKAAQCDDKGDD